MFHFLFPALSDYFMLQLHGQLHSEGERKHDIYVLFFCVITTALFLQTPRASSNKIHTRHLCFSLKKVCSCTTVIRNGTLSSFVCLCHLLTSVL